MLTLKLITEETERVIRGLEKKHFKGAKEAIDEVLSVDKRRREAQQQLDKNLAEAKKLAAQIGGLMKEGKKDEAEAVKAQVSAMKETNKQLEQTMNESQDEMTRLLCQIPNIPYDLMTVEQLQAVILSKLAKNGPVTDQMRRDVAENIWHNSLVNWANSF